MKTGWQKIDGKWYYFDSEGIMQTGWIKDKDKDYFLYSNGEMLQGCDMYGFRFLEDEWRLNYNKKSFTRFKV